MPTPAHRHPTVSTAPRGLNLSLRRLGLDVQSRLYAPITGCLAGILFCLGGVFWVLRRWLNDEIRLSASEITESLGGAWVARHGPDADSDLGPNLARNHAPFLWDEIEFVARRVGTRAPRVVHLTYLPCCAVVASAGKERALLVGLPLLNVLNHGELRAVLAHELAHWAKRDASRVARSTQFLGRLDQSYTRAHQTAPAWARISPLSLWARANLAAGRSLHAPLVRGQEIHADAVSATIAGGAAAASALVKTALVQPLFREVLDHVEQKGVADTNIYTFFRAFWARLPPEVLVNMRHRLFTRTSNTPDAAHPELLDRISFVQAYPARAFDGAHRRASSLVADAESWEPVLHQRLFGSAPLVEPSVFHRAGG